MRTIEQAVLEAIGLHTEKRPVSLNDRLNEDLWLDGMQTAAIALRLQEELDRKPTAEAYRGVATVADFVAVFEDARSLS